MVEFFGGVIEGGGGVVYVVFVFDDGDNVVELEGEFVGGGEVFVGVRNVGDVYIEVGE